MIRFLCLFAVAISAPGWQTPQKSGLGRRLYVEPFTTREGSEKLRDDVISELRKLGSVSLAASAQAADVVLGGGGEIWERGYQCLNPRSGRSPSNGTPVYGGYLSVELYGIRKAPRFGPIW